MFSLVCRAGTVQSTTCLEVNRGISSYRRLLYTSTHSNISQVSRRCFSTSSHVRQCDNQPEAKGPSEEIPSQICKYDKQPEAKSLCEEWDRLKKRVEIFRGKSGYQQGKFGLYLLLLVLGVVGVSLDRFLSDVFFPNLKEELYDPAVERVRKKIGTWEEKKDVISYKCPEGIEERRAPITALDNIFSKSTENIIRIEITGASGSGKTVLAQTYANRYNQKVKEKYPKDKEKTICIMDASDLQTLTLEYTEFAKKLGVRLKIDQPIKELIAQVNQKLLDRPHWLLIFDNVKDFDKIEKFIPQVTSNRLVKNQKGVVIFTTKDTINQSDHIINLTSEKFRLTNAEARKLFDGVLGQHPAVGKYVERKEKLFDKLDYNPFFIRFFALSLKSSTFFESDLNRLLTQDKKNMMKKEIEKIKRQSEKIRRQPSNYYQLIEFLAFINTQNVSSRLIEKWWEGKGYSSSLLDSALEMLRERMFIEKIGYSYKMHQCVQDAIISELKDPAQKLREAFQFLDKSLKIDFTSKQSLQEAQDFALHVAATFQHYLLFKGETETYPPEVISGLVKSGNFYLQSNQLYEAKQAFEFALKIFPAFDKSNSGEVIVDNLVVHDTRLPALYAKASHYLGKVLFLANDTQAESHLNEAIKLRAAIDGSPPGKCTNLDRFDSVIFKRQGYGWLLIEQGKLDDAKDLYLELRKEPDNQHRNQMYCDLQLAKVYREKALISDSPMSITQNYQNAIIHIDDACKELKKYNEKLKREGSKSVEKSGEYLLTKAKLLSDDANPQRDQAKAEEIINDLLNPKISEDDAPNGETVMGARLLRAKISIQEGDLKQARKDLQAVRDYHEKVHELVIAPFKEKKKLENLEQQLECLERPFECLERQFESLER